MLYSTIPGGTYRFREDCIAHYLFIHPTRRSITHHRRTGAATTTIHVNGPITLDPPGLTITVEEVYGPTPA